jgi:hypothetical protein
VEADDAGPAKYHSTQAPRQLRAPLLRLIQDQVHVLVQPEETTGEETVILESQLDALLEYFFQKLGRRRHGRADRRPKDNPFRAAFAV